MADNEAIDLPSVATLPESEPTPLEPSAPLPVETPAVQRLLEETQQREQEARRALNLLVTIVDELPVGLTVQSDDGTTLFTNGTAGQFFGAATGSDTAKSEDNECEDVKAGATKSDATKSDATMSEDSV